jgi:thioredoxin 1
VTSRTAIDSDDEFWVVCLCAAWCGVCRDWRPAFEQLARSRPGWRFAWVDVEDEDAAMGDVEVETFPTVLLARGGRALFLGPVAPSPAGVAQLAQRLQAQAQPPAAASPPSQQLLERLDRGALARGAL